MGGEVVAPHLGAKSRWAGCYPSLMLMFPCGDWCLVVGREQLAELRGPEVALELVRNHAADCVGAPGLTVVG